MLLLLQGKAAGHRANCLGCSLSRLGYWAHAYGKSQIIADRCRCR